MSHEGRNNRLSCGKYTYFIEHTQQNQDCYHSYRIHKKASSKIGNMPIAQPPATFWVENAADECFSTLFGSIKRFKCDCRKRSELRAGHFEASTSSTNKHFDTYN